MNCEQFDEISGAYALGALEDGELREAEEHLRICRRHAEVRELAGVAAGLALSAPEMEPPPELRSRLMAAVRAEAASEVSATPAPKARSGAWDTIRSWISGPRFGYALAGGMAVLVAALLVWNISLQGDGGGSGQTLVTLSGQATGRVIFLEDENLAVMDVEGLERPGADEVYQVWAISDGEPASLGFLEVAEGGRARGAMDADLAGVDIIAVTIEQAPGAEQPTSDPVVQGRL